MRTVNSIYLLLFFCAVPAKSSANISQDLVNIQNQTSYCGYKRCPLTKPDMLNVHIVPHSHNDVGWIKTVDEYYYGNNNKVQYAGVQYILDSVIEALLSDPEKRFVYAESAFFFKWWNFQTDSLKEQVKQLVNEGRLEFVGGAWCMNDEATVTYQSVIDQFTLGLRKLNDTFGECGRPKIGWQIDSFGQSREMSSLIAQMGYDGLFLTRIDYQEKSYSLNQKTPEFIWRSSNNLGKNSHLFSALLYNNYNAPEGYCFDMLCNDEPIVDDKNSPKYNVDERIDGFIQYVVGQSQFFKTNNVIVTMGSDFNYMAAGMNYKNMDKLIRYANDRQKTGSNVNLFYSTPSCYLKSLNEANITWPTKTNDFFPYSSDPYSYWTGYYTSRPNLKRFERVGNNYLQICKQLTALASKRTYDFEKNLSLLKAAMAVLQHHDAITGTESQNVADDYSFSLQQGIDACSENIQNVLNEKTTEYISEENTKKHEHLYSTFDAFEFKSCHQLNISQCDISENSDRFVVTLYNSLSHKSHQIVRIPVHNANYSVRDYKGQPISFQMVPIHRSIQKIHYRKSKSDFELVFLAKSIPPIGYKSYFIYRDKRKPSGIEDILEPNTLRKKDEIVIGYPLLNITFTKNGELSKIFSNGISSKLNQKFFYYEAAAGNNEVFENRSSGSYIFRPNANIEEQLISNNISITVIRGPIVDEVHQVFNSWLSQVVRVYKNKNFVEFDWLIGPIPVSDNIGKEIITRFYTDIQSNGVWYTDSNGREMISRPRNYRETWHLNIYETIPVNYYPVPNKIAIQDKHMRLAVLTDRSQGGSSLNDGTLELLIQRQLLNSDAFGLAEPLNEFAYGKGVITRGKHYLIFGPTKLSSPSLIAQERFLQKRKTLENWMFFSNASNTSLREWKSEYNNIYSGLSESLPPNINLLSLETINNDSILVRFEHIFEKNEDPVYSEPVVVNIGQVFNNFNITDIRETTLAGNQWLDESKRFIFKEKVETDTEDVSEREPLTNNTFSLGPMQIRTFIIRVM